MRFKQFLSRDTAGTGNPPRRGLIFLAVIGIVVASTVLTGVLLEQLDAVFALLMAEVALIRIYSLFRSVAWIWKRGATFDAGWNGLDVAIRAEVIDDTAAGRAQLQALYASTGGLFFPFGIRAMVITRWVDAANGRRRGLRKMINRLWKFYFFTPVWTISVAVLAYVAGPTLSATAQIAGLVGVSLVLLGCLSIGIEAALSYLIFRGWSLSYHQLNVQAKQSVTEFAAFAGGALSLILSTQAAVAFAARCTNGYVLIQPTYGIARQIGLSFYYTVTMLTGNGDPGPRSFSGHIVTSLTYATAVLFLVIVISLLFDAISGSPETKPPEVATPAPADPATPPSTSRSPAPHPRPRPRP